MPIMQPRKNWKQALLALLCAGPLLVCLIGCQPNAEPIERATTTIFKDIVVPTVTKAVAETSVRTATLQAGAELIRPGLVTEFEGFWVVGVKGKASVHADGVAGQLTGHAQGDQGEALPDERPVGDRTPKTQPAADQEDLGPAPASQ
jgi:hypothetical protein